MKQLSPAASQQIVFDWLEPDSRTLAALAGECLDRVRSLPKDRTVVVISCGRNKKQTKDKVSELYTSQRFRLSRHLAERLGLQYFVVSAKHGLLEPTATIEPYDVSLETLSGEQRVAWAKDVLNRLLSASKKTVHVISLADDEYAAPLRDLFNEKKIPVTQPLEGFSKEARLALLKECSRLLDRTDAVRAFYEMFEHITAKSAILPLREALQNPMPEQGVYFFFDPEEKTRFSKCLGRLVRIGTHGVSAGSKATLRDRLRTHLGTSDGYGNHRSSVFRLHVGEAIIRRDGLRKRFPQCGNGQNSSPVVRERERPLEKKVSDVISKLHVANVKVADESTKASARSVIERLTIALFTENYQPVECSSPHWLGRNSAHDLISKTGLWNLREVGSKADLDVIKIIRARL
jgi:hypothetical protein